MLESVQKGEKRLSRDRKRLERSGKEISNLNVLGCSTAEQQCSSRQFRETVLSLRNVIFNVETVREKNDFAVTSLETCARILLNM